MCVRRKRKKTRVFYKMQWKNVLKDRDQPFETQIPRQQIERQNETKRCSEFWASEAADLSLVPESVRER